jgi:hypothetical protein
MNMVLPETLVSAIRKGGQQSSDSIRNLVYHNKWNQGTSCHLTRAVNRRVTTPGNKQKHKTNSVFTDTSVPLYMWTFY